MSCGKPHEVPCTDVLDQVIRQHLDECGPCLREYGLEEAVKQLVHKHCGRDTVPADLRAKVLIRIKQVQAEIRVTRSPAD